MGRYDTFAETLLQLNRNISRTRLGSNPGVVEMRQISESFKVQDAAATRRIGPDYFPYPSWNTNDLWFWFPFAVLDPTRDGYLGRQLALRTGEAHPTIHKDFSLYPNDTINRYREFARFLGSSNYVYQVTSSDFNDPNQATFGCRVKISTRTSERGLIRFEGDSSNRDTDIVIDSDGALISTMTSNNVDRITRSPNDT